MRVLLVTILLISAAPFQAVRAAAAEELWSSKIQPLFDVHCVKCHGPIEQKSGLELDTAQAVFNGGDEGKVVTPGKPDESRLFQYLAPDSDPHMPPKKQLSDADRDLIRQWIEALPSDLAKVESAPQPSGNFRDFPNISEAINFYIAEGWQKRSIQPARAVDDRTWCRRLYLDLAGRIPSATELQSFLQSTSPSRRADLIDQLLASDEYPIRMRELWDVFLMGRVKRDNHEDRRKNNGWWAFLEYSFRENRPWNETVREILVARPSKPELKGAFWFLYERRDEHQRIAEAVSPIVYGTKIDCAQCHDHPLAREIKQAHFWGLVAAFNRGKNVRDEGVSESAIGGFVNFTNLKKESQPARVTLLTGKTIPETWPDGDKKEEDADDKYVDPKARVRVPKASRREAFADAATQDNPLLARAFVNRMWAVFTGRGIVNPADEMNARNVPSHPELLDWLAKDFEQSNYDVKRLVRGILLSHVYELGSANLPPETFAGARERALTAEQLARSWRIAAGIDKKNEDDSLRRALVFALPDVMPREYNATFQQAQVLENSPALAKMLSPHDGNTAEQLLKLETDDQKIQAAFAAVFARCPDPEEIAASKDFLNGRENKEAAVRDFLWALMTSAEFLTMP